MIPKIIHYCWFGGKSKTKFNLACIDTWRRKLPSYKIIEWNEQNFPITYNQYVQEAYENRKYAFVSDVARLYALSNMGGIYFDTDIEVRRSLDDYLDKGKVIMSFESNKVVMTGFLAAEKENFFITKWLHTYDSIKFIANNGKFDVTPNTFRVSDMLKNYGLKYTGDYQELNGGILIYPKEIFGAYDVDNSGYVITKDTVLVHHCKNSWMPISYKIKDQFKRTLTRCIGIQNSNTIRKLIKGNDKR